MVSGILLRHLVNVNDAVLVDRHILASRGRRAHHHLFSFGVLACPTVLYTAAPLPATKINVCRFLSDLLSLNGIRICA